MGSSVERIECCVRSRGLSTGEVARRGAAAERGPRRARRGGTSVAFRDRSKQVPSTGRTAMKPIQLALGLSFLVAASGAAQSRGLREVRRDRKSTRLNSSHLVISYAVFCLKKKKKRIRQNRWNN